MAGHPLNDDKGWGWAIFVVRPGGDLLVYRLPQPMDPTAAREAFSAAVSAARADAAMPDNANPVDSDWDLSISPGEPHPTVLDRARIIDWSGGVPG